MSRWNASDVAVEPEFLATLEDIRRAANEGHLEDAIDSLCVVAEYQERSTERVRQINERLVEVIGRLTEGMVQSG